MDFTGNEVLRWQTQMEHSAVKVAVFQNRKNPEKLQNIIMIMNTGIIVSIAYLPSMALINNDIWDILTPLVLITAIPKIKEPTVLPSLIKSGIMNSQINIEINMPKLRVIIIKLVTIE